MGGQGCNLPVGEEWQQRFSVCSSQTCGPVHILPEMIGAGVRGPSSKFIHHVMVWFSTVYCDFLERDSTMVSRLTRSLSESGGYCERAAVVLEGLHSPKP